MVLRYQNKYKKWYNKNRGKVVWKE
jgi:hypothetical protein